MYKELQIELSRFGKAVVKQARTNLTKQQREDTKDLYNSIKYDLEVNRQSFSLSFEMLEYGIYVDQGVKGKNSSNKAPRSPFKFGSGTGKKGGLTRSIEKWVKRKNIKFRNKKGQFITSKQTSFLISRSIYQKGIKPSLFFTKPFEAAFNRLPDELIVQFGLDINDFLEESLKQPLNANV